MKKINNENNVLLFSWYYNLTCIFFIHDYSHVQFIRRLFCKEYRHPAVLNLISIPHTRSVSKSDQKSDQTNNSEIHKDVQYLFL